MGDRRPLLDSSEPAHSRVGVILPTIDTNSPSSKVVLRFLTTEEGIDTIDDIRLLDR